MCVCVCVCDFWVRRAAPWCSLFLWKFRSDKLYCWDSWSKLKYEDFNLIRYQSEDKFQLMKTEHQVHIMVFGVVTYDSGVKPPFLFSRAQTQQNLEECCPGWRGWLLEDHTFENRALHHATQAGEPSGGCPKFLVTTSPLKSSHPTSEFAMPLCDGLLAKRLTKLRTTPKKN